MNSELVFNTMEVLETKPINELVTEATIKVCYVSELPNRNGTVITKEVGREIAATLPGAPVVGLFNKDNNDFVEHSRKITVNGGEIQIEDLTKPYGFVSFDNPWYQDFIEDGVSHTYLMCKAYLWTKQFPEAKLALNKGQSMELQEGNLSGYYEGDVFVFTHATLDKLCILGDQYEPCFEGARIMTTYAKVYNTFAEEVEDILGRRYFVYQGQLVPNMEKNTVKYALELGYDLHEAIYNQLRDRGAEDQYSIQGIFAESNGGMYVILQNMTTLAFIKVSITINADDTITLDATMQEVAMKWIDVAPQDDTKVDPIDSGTQVVATNTAPQAVVYSTNEEANARITELEAQVAEYTTKETTYTTKIADLETQLAQYTEAAVDNTNETVANDAAAQTNDNADVNTDTDDNQVNSDPIVDPIDNPEGDSAPTLDDASNGDVEPTSTQDVTEFTQQIADLESKVSELTEQLNAYKLAEEEANKQAKNEMINSYKAVLSEDEINAVAEKVNEYSLEQVEEKLSVLYARKNMVKQPETQFQLNVNLDNNQDSNDNIPDFMKQAMEYEQTHQL